jgi:cytosine/adenosine deaminase-related metal-dependent hydrolase
MQKAGVRLCLGTDSLASSPSLSLLSEAVALREEVPEISPEALLEMCTLAGAEVLGFAEEGIGQLRPDGVADFVVVDPPSGKESLVPAHLFHPEAQVRTTFIGGVNRFDRER